MSRSSRVVVAVAIAATFVPALAGARAAAGTPRAVLTGAVHERVVYFGETLWSGRAAGASVALYASDPRLIPVDPAHRGAPPGYLALTQTNDRGVFVLNAPERPESAWVWVGVPVRSFGYTSWWTAVEQAVKPGACSIEVVVPAELV